MSDLLEIMENPMESIEISSSAEMGEIFGALAKAQGEIKGAIKDTTNPFYKSKYADLSSVWEACREALSKNGLCVVQPLETKDAVYVVTILGHSSGQWIKGRMPVFIAEQKKSDPQAYGLAITYARRYSLAAMAGVAPEDDDGNAASNVETQNTKPPQASKRTAKAVSEHGGEIIRNLVLCSSVEDVDRYAKEVATEVAGIAKESSTVANTIKDQFALRRDMLRQSPASNGVAQ